MQPVRDRNLILFLVFGSMAAAVLIGFGLVRLLSDRAEIEEDLLRERSFLAAWSAGALAGTGELFSLDRLFHRRRDGPMVDERPLLLLADDEPGFVLPLRDNLDLEGYRVEVASDGEEALQKALEFGPDLLLLDIMMPKMNGLDVCRELRSG